ncbi:MAG TPA: LLM class F420-dependent oxidoreductase [Streptosporangiaceae bacterium]|jgi:probable F420-dependent oxidoreductase|nr:LLM class F420-dependent oxidoreductase [Streptosporangiaceae bacterium]
MVELGRFGVFRRNTALSPELAATLEELGYGAIWVGGSPDGDLREIEELLDATSTIPVATGIVNIWKDGPREVAASYHRIEERHPGRFLLGIGVGHPEATGARYTKPYAALVDYLDELDAAGVPVQRRVLAALGPRVLKLSAERSAGAHPYLVTPEHTRRARDILGPGPLLAPEQKVVLETDPARARAIARPAVEKPYLGLVNYTNNLRTLGFGDGDLADGGSDRLIDALAIHGDTAAVTAGLTAHLEAGADHVSVNLITAQGDDPVAGFTALAGVLPR